MSWMSELVDLYDRNQNKAGKVTNVKRRGKNGETVLKPVFLLPINHVSNYVEIEIKLNLDGDFVGAEVINKEKTIMPVTIESAARTSGIRPRPVDDKFQYIARDYNQLQEVLEAKREPGEHKDKPYKQDGDFDEYLQQLTDFFEFTKEHSKTVAPLLMAIQKYVANNDLIIDLIHSGQFGELDSYEDIDEKIILANNPLCRFNVLTEGPVRWKNPECFKAWSDFYQFKLAKEGKTGFDYVAGNEHVPLSTNHPKGILPLASGAKLISSNDTQNFTFRGRFINSEEAVSIGYESSQKGHAMLKWLIDKQGFSIGGRYYITWGTTGENLTTINPQDNELFNDILSLDDEIEDTNSAFASQLRNLLLKGASVNGIPKQNPVYVMQLEGTTTGRFGIVYYQALDLTTYIERITDWYTKLYLKFDDNKYIYPSLKFIADRIYGDRNDETTQKLKKDVVTDLVQSILGGRKISYSYLSKIFQKSIRPTSFDNQSAWKLTVTTAARLFKSYFSREEIEPMLNTDFKDRSYLYGRLLAIADVVEQGVLGANGQDRSTNARRYMSAFSQRPADTWKVIYVNLQPYLTKSNYRQKAQRLFDEINEKFDVTDSQLNSPLDGKFLIGYSQQRTDWYKSSKSKSEVE